MATMTLRSIILYVLSFILGGATTYTVIALTDTEDPPIDGEVLPVSATDAATYIENYWNWARSADGPEKIQLQAYNINANLLAAIERHRSSTITSDYVRTYYAFQEEPVSGTTLPDLYMVVFPLNETCDELRVSDDVYMAKMSPEFSRPCPDFCDLLEY